MPTDILTHCLQALNDSYSETKMTFFLNVQVLCSCTFPSKEAAPEIGEVAKPSSQKQMVALASSLDFSHHFCALLS